MEKDEVFDNAWMKERLKHLGLGADDLTADTLIVRAHDPVRLEADGDPLRPQAHYARSIAELRSLIGIGEKVAKKHADQFKARYQKEPLLAKPNGKKGDNKEEDHPPAYALALAAKHYLNGYGVLTAQQARALDLLASRIPIQRWAYKRIEVERHATLLVGPGAHVLLAHTVIIHPGGRIRAAGSLTLRCQSLRRP